MNTLLTISIGQFGAVELTLKLCVALMGMLAFLLVATAACLPRPNRFPLILGGVALAGATWFASGVWVAWKDAFELAGTSYCVTGHLLADEDRIAAWAVGVPLILFSFCCAGFSHAEKKSENFGLIKSATFLAMGVLSIFSGMLTLAVLLGWAVTLWYPRLPKPVLLQETRAATLSVFIAMILTALGSKGLLPMGKTPDALLVHGEIIRSIANILSFVIPGSLLLTGVLRMGSIVSEQPSKSPYPKEKKTKPLATGIADPQSNLFGS